MKLLVFIIICATVHSLEWYEVGYTMYDSNGQPTNITRNTRSIDIGNGPTKKIVWTDFPPTYIWQGIISPSQVFVAATTPPDGNNTFSITIKFVPPSSIPKGSICVDDDVECPDLMVTAASQLRTLADAGDIMMLDDYFAQFFFDKGISLVGEIQQITYLYLYFQSTQTTDETGHWHGVPLSAESRPLYFNEKIYNQTYPANQTTPNNRTMLKQPPPWDDWGPKFYETFTFDTFTDQMRWLAQNGNEYNMYFSVYFNGLLFWVALLMQNLKIPLYDANKICQWNRPEATVYLEEHFYKLFTEYKTAKISINEDDPNFQAWMTGEIRSFPFSTIDPTDLAFHSNVDSYAMVFGNVPSIYPQYKMGYMPGIKTMSGAVTYAIPARIPQWRKDTSWNIIDIAIDPNNIFGKVAAINIGGLPGLLSNMVGEYETKKWKASVDSRSRSGPWSDPKFFTQMGDIVSTRPVLAGLMNWIYKNRTAQECTDLTCDIIQENLDKSCTSADYHFVVGQNCEQQDRFVTFEWNADTQCATSKHALPNTTTIKCDYFEMNSSQGDTLIAIVSIATAIAATILVTVLYKYIKMIYNIKKERRRLRALAGIPNVVVCGGCLVAICSQYLAGGEPSDELCKWYPIMICLGYYLIMTGLLVKAAIINMLVYKLDSKNFKNIGVVKHLPMLWLYCFLIILAYMTLIFVWAFESNGPGIIYTQTRYDLIDGYVKDSKCSTGNDTLLAILYFISAAPLLVGFGFSFFLIFSIKKVPEDLKNMIMHQGEVETLIMTIGMSVLMAGCVVVVSFTSDDIVSNVMMRIILIIVAVVFIMAKFMFDWVKHLDRSSMSSGSVDTIANGRRTITYVSRVDALNRGSGARNSHKSVCVEMTDIMQKAIKE